MAAEGLFLVVLVPPLLSHGEVVAWTMVDWVDGGCGIKVQRDGVVTHAIGRRNSLVDPGEMTLWGFPLVTVRI